MTNHIQDTEAHNTYVVSVYLFVCVRGLAEDELPESQCAWVQERYIGDIDMIFTIHQLVEKSWEHKCYLFLQISRKLKTWYHEKLCG